MTAAEVAMTADERDPCTDLIVAQALSLTIREEVGPAATEELLRAADGDNDRLERAFQRCLLCDVLDKTTVRRAARLIQRALYLSRTKPLVGSS